ncbi:hypothetical protein ACH5RR_034818 [Cinchona calisaya]|uniref:Uncharacterized protein n=1 Tax=Cinchona calisaya TaxID=153742 RepID=A0ABD2YGG2_9GENT
MQKYSSTHGEFKRDEYSCWGRLKLMLPWIRSRRKGRQNHQQSILHGGKMMGGCDCVSIVETQGQRPAPGSFRYSPLSYAQNFDQWVEDNDEDSILVDFSSRYAAPTNSSISLHERK